MECCSKKVKTFLDGMLNQGKFKYYVHCVGPGVNCYIT